MDHKDCYINLGEKQRRDAIQELRQVHQLKYKKYPQQRLQSKQKIKIILWEKKIKQKKKKIFGFQSTSPSQTDICDKKKKQ